MEQLDMLIAEIRRKLNTTLLAESKEDLLTSDVFGALKYLPRRPYLAEVLTSILSRSPHTSALDRVLARVEKYTFSFWPNYPAPRGLPGGSTEPDLVVENKDALIFVEAKLHSGLGDRQIERQLAIALERATEREVFVVVVSNGLRMPRFPGYAPATFAEYLQQRRSDGSMSLELADTLLSNATRVIWINWRSVQAAMERAHSNDVQRMGNACETVARAGDMLTDLWQLLKMRGIHPFQGLAQAIGGSATVPEGALFRLEAAAAIRSLSRLEFSLESVLGMKPEPVSLPWYRMKLRSRTSTRQLRMMDAVARWPEPSPRCGLSFGAPDA